MGNEQSYQDFVDELNGWAEEIDKLVEHNVGYENIKRAVEKGNEVYREANEHLEEGYSLDLDVEEMAHETLQDMGYESAEDAVKDKDNAFKEPLQTENNGDQMMKLVDAQINYQRSVDNADDEYERDLDVPEANLGKPVEVGEELFP